MRTLFRYRLIQLLRDRACMFWGMAFPLILGTLFYFSFGSLGQESWQNIPTALVEISSNEAFSQYVDSLEEDWLTLTPMTQEEAQKALEEGKVTGIFYEDREPSLTVAANGIRQTILSFLLKAYTDNASILEDIAQTHPEGLPDALAAMTDYQSYMESVSLGGRTYDNTLDYFFALIALACFYGSFLGSNLANQNMANMSALGARRSISPVSKLKIVLVDMGCGVLVQFACTLVLLAYLNFVLGIEFAGNWAGMILICLLGSLSGVSFGIAVGSSARLKEKAKTLLLVLGPLLSSFLSGLMFSGIKQGIARVCPLINHINPATLITDAFYCLVVYQDFGRLAINLITLAAISLALAGLAFFSLRRERYDSI